MLKSAELGRGFFTQLNTRSKVVLAHDGRMSMSMKRRGAVASQLLKFGFQGWSTSMGSARVGQRLHAPRAASSSSTSEQSTPAGPEPERILIVGGGFGGLYTAVRLGALFWPKGRKPQITLVDQSGHFTFKPLLYDYLEGSAIEEEVAPSFDLILAPYPVRFLQAKVTGIIPDDVLRDGGSASGGKVKLADGNSLDYDWLVVALGAQADSRGIPGVKERALPFNTYEDAVQVKEVLETICRNDNGGIIMVAGAGYAGVELATAVAKLVQGRARVQLLTPSQGILEGSPEGQRHAARLALSQLGVETLLSTKVVALRGKASNEGPQLPTSCTVDMQMADGTAGSQDVDCVMWTAGSSPVTKTAEKRKGFPLPLNETGSVMTDATLRVALHSRIFALGDVVMSGKGYAQDSATSQPLPATAQVALQQADYVAWNLWAAMNGRQLLPFRYQHLGNMMSLGTMNAAVAVPLPLPLPVKMSLKSSPLGPIMEMAGIRMEEGDPDNGVTLEGPIAAAVRRAAYLYRQPTNEQRINVAAGWFTSAVGMAADMAGIKMPEAQPYQAPPPEPHNETPAPPTPGAEDVPPRTPGSTP